MRQKRKHFLYLGLAVGLSLLAALLLISITAFADREPPSTPVSPEKERDAWRRRTFSPGDRERVKGTPGEYLAASVTPPSTGGPDAFGYTFKDSNEPDGPIYNFESISSTGMLISLSNDQVSGAIPIGFPFNYYGTNYTDVYVSSDGFLTVLSDQYSGGYPEDPIPSPYGPNGVIASWWGDLDPSVGGTIHYQTMGTAPNRRFIVQVTDVPNWLWIGAPITFVTFQYKLFEGTNDIEVHYQAAPSDGSWHSVGIEDENGAVGLQYYCGSASLGTPLAVRYDPPPVGLSPGVASGPGLPGSTVVYTERVVNLTGATDSFTIAASGNGWPTTPSINNTGPIADGASATFTVLVDIPPGADAGDHDSTTILATSTLNPGTHSATATLTTTALSGQYGYVLNPEDDKINVVDTVIHMDTREMLDTSLSGSFPWYGALSPNGQWLYASLRDSDQVLVIDSATHTPVITLPVGSYPHGIAFTADSNYAFVANLSSDTVSVIDTSVPIVTATISVGDTPWNVGSSPCLGKAYVTNFGDNTVGVIDLGTLTVTRVITGFAGPWDVVISPYGDRAFVSNYWGGTIGVIDTTNDSLADTWDVGGLAPVGIDISPDGHTLYVADRYQNFYAVDAVTGQMVGTMPAGANSWDVEVFPTSAKAFAYVSVPWENDVKVVNINTNRIVRTIPLDGHPHGLALFPPSTACQHDVLLAPSRTMGSGNAGSTVTYTKTVVNLTGATDSFALTASGNTWPTTLSVNNTGPISDKVSFEFTVHVDIPPGANPADFDDAAIAATSVNNPSTYSNTATITTTALSGQYVFVFTPGKINFVDPVVHVDTGLSIDTSSYGPSHGALSPNGQWLYASLHSEVLVIDLTTHTPVTTVPVGSNPTDIAFTADSNYAFVANWWSNTVSVIDTSVPAVSVTIPVGVEPHSVASSPCLSKVYVTNWYGGTVSVIDANTLTVTRVITGFVGPEDIIISPYGRRAYVTDYRDGTIGVIDTASDRLVDTWDVGVWEPAELDISPSGHTLYAAGRSTGATYAVDTSTGQLIATIPTGGAWDIEVFPPEAGPFAYVSNGDDLQVAVVNIDTNSLVGTIMLNSQPRGLALFPPPTSCYARIYLPLVTRNYP